VRRPGLRSVLVPFFLLALVAAGCATSSAPAPASTVGAGPGTAQTDAAPAPESADPREAQARAQLGLGWTAILRGDMAAATIFLREALRLQPEMIEARERLGQALYGMGDVDGAVEEFRAVLQQRPDRVATRHLLGTALMAKQDWAAARAELEDVVRRDPGLVGVLYSLGFVQYALGDLNGAIETYRRVLVLRPEFPDARYSLAVVLKLAQGDAGATKEFLAAAEAGHPHAQYFAGTAYAKGFGVERSLPLAIAWWSRAVDQGSTAASGELLQLRRIALGWNRRPPAERQAALQAFQEHRATLWAGFPELARDGDDDTVGAALLRQGRGREAVRMLIREASLLSEPAQGLLETIYYHGVRGQLPAHDPKVLAYFQSAAAEGQVRPRISLARFYAGGLGVPQDTARAISLLKATPHDDAQRLLQELLASSPAPARP